MKNIKVLLGKRIAELRKNIGCKQEMLAEKIGIDPRSLSFIETGRSFPSPATLEKILEVLGIESFELFTFDTKDDSKETYEKLISKIELLKQNKEKIKSIYAFVKCITN